MKNRLLALEQSLSLDAQSKLAEAKELYSTQFDRLADEIVAKLPVWMKDKIGIKPNGEIDFRRSIYDARWDDAQYAIDRMAPGSYAIFGARIADPQSPQNHNHDKFSTSQILIMMPKQVKAIEINFVKRFQDFNSFEQGLIDAGIAVRKGGFTNYTKDYWEWVSKMYSPQFSVAQEKELPPEVKFWGRSQRPYIDIKPSSNYPYDYIYLSDEMISNLKGLRGAEHDVPISMIIDAANNAVRRGSPDEVGTSDAFFYAIQGLDSEGGPILLNKHLCLVLSKRRDNLVTAYFTSKSQVMHKLGLNETTYGMRFRDRKKLTMPT